MEYQDFPYDENRKSFINQPEVLEYIDKFATHFNLNPHIKFLRHIEKIEPLPNKKWKVVEKNLRTNEIKDHTFEAVMICVGNYSVPKLPSIPGCDALGTRAIHSHNFRKPDEYKGKKVLIIGAGPSGVDIARIVGAVAEKVYISHGQRVFDQTEKYVIHKPLVKSFESRSKATFEDGSEEIIDNVIYCTGYQYSYPFLTPECKISIENNWVKYLYKHIVNVEHPTMGFIGITFTVCPFPMSDIQVRFFLEFIKDVNRITKEEMMADILDDVKERKEKAYPQHHVHKIGNKHQKAYSDDLAKTAKIKPVRPVIHKMYEHLAKGRDISKTYKIINDEDFIELN